MLDHASSGLTITQKAWLLCTRSTSMLSACRFQRYHCRSAVFLSLPPFCRAHRGWTQHCGCLSCLIPSESKGHACRESKSAKRIALGLVSLQAGPFSFPQALKLRPAVGPRLAGKGKAMMSKPSILTCFAIRGQRQPHREQATSHLYAYRNRLAAKTGNRGGRRPSFCRV